MNKYLRTIKYDLIHWRFMNILFLLIVSLIIYQVNSLASNQFSSSQKILKVGLLSLEKDITDSEVIAAINFLKQDVNFDVEVVQFESIKNQTSALKKFDIIWYHRPDSSVLNPLEVHESVLNSIKEFVKNGGGLFLTLDALKLLKPLKLEDFEPTVNYTNAFDEGYGRKLGLHAYRSHPLFSGLNGGAYIWAPLKDQINRQVGYFGDNIPKGKVVAVDWAYIMLKENSKLVFEYSLGKGKVIAVGAYTYYAPENQNKTHLELFTKNCLSYSAGFNTNENINYWDYSKPEVSSFDYESEPFTIPASKKWEIDNTNPLLHARFASDNFWDLAGQKIVMMGYQKGGIDEIWTHPFMAFRDYEVGIKFSYRDTVYWFKDQRPEIEVKPESITRLYKFSNAYIKEVITCDSENPAGVIHYEYRGIYDGNLVIKLKSNLRFMWPYSEEAFRKINYKWNDSLNAFIIKDGNGDFISMIGANKKPYKKLFGRYDDFNYSNKEWSGVNTDKFQAAAMFEYELKMNDNLDIVMLGTVEGIEEGVKLYQNVITNPQSVYLKSVKHYADFLNLTLSIITPDKVFNEGFKWALMGTEKFFVNTPGLGSSLVAGYSTTARGWTGGHKVNGRPGYGWYFGRDGQWSGFALLDYGDFEKVKSILEMYQKYQDLSGKIYHELTTSGVVHYDAADATPLYIVLAGEYLKHSGDVTFIKQSWPHIKRAIDFCFSTDTNGDHLIENTLVGHGWVEGGSLYGAHTTFYLAGCWAEALNKASYMANALGLPNEEALFLGEYELVKKQINDEFWNEDDQFFYYGKFKDGTFNPERTVLPSVPLLFNLADADKAYKVIDVYAANEFTSDWGMRILSEQSPLFNPKGYHYGSVWPLFTGWTSLAEYKYGNYLQGYSHIMNNLSVYNNWALGYVEEVLNGAEYLPSGVCPHQCWSETMVLQPIMEGMLGLNPSAVENKFILSPRFPFDWDSVVVKNIKINRSVLNFEFKRNKTMTIYNFSHQGENKLMVDFSLSFPPGTEIQKVLIDRSETSYEILDERQSIIINLSFEISSSSIIEIYQDKGISVLPAISAPIEGEISNGFRIISAKLNGNEYLIEVQSRPKQVEELKIYSSTEQVKSIENAEVAKYENRIYTININFEASEQKYVNKIVKLNLR